MNTMNQNGRSMIEMLGVLAIIGVLSVGGIAGYSKAMLKYKTNKTIDQITMLTTNIRTLYAQQKKFTGVDYEADAAVSTGIGLLGVVPDEMIKNDTLKNPFSGTVTITKGHSVDGAAGEDRAFTIGVNGIPKEACMAIAVSDWGSNYSSGLIGMAVANTGTVSTVIDEEMFAGCTSGAGSSVKDADNKDVNSGKGQADANGAICAKNMPLSVATASTLCACNGSECSVAFKYY